MPFSIFVIDDNTEILELIRYNLENIDQVKIHLFNDPVQALRNISDDLIPEIIITDLNMPGINGIDLIKKAKQKNNQLRAIVFTGEPDKIPSGFDYPVISKIEESFPVLYDKIIGMLKVFNHA